VSSRSADLGAKDAERIREAIKTSMQVIDAYKGSRMQWWGGFLATLASMCLEQVGPNAHDVLMSVTTEALKNSTKPVPKGKLQ
jgi:hypothetical protein